MSWINACCSGPWCFDRNVTRSVCEDLPPDATFGSCETTTSPFRSRHKYQLSPLELVQSFLPCTAMATLHIARQVLCGERVFAHIRGKSVLGGCGSISG